MDMATVYLPFGYPTLSGQQFENVIYQGNLVRLYSVPTDPRTTAQLQSRRILADLTKMRSHLGTWAKGACKASMGSRWATVIHQLIRIDNESWWSNAMAEWEDFGSGNKDDWRAVAPYQATFNDMGAIFFGLTRVLYYALDHFSGVTWKAELWAENESADALAWWEKTIVDALTKGNYDLSTGNADFVGSWTDRFNINAWGDYFKRGNSGGSQSISAFIYGRFFNAGMFAMPDGGDCEIYLDGQLIDTVSLYYASQDFAVFKEYDAAFKGLHHLKFKPKTGYSGVDFVQVL